MNSNSLKLRIARYIFDYGAVDGLLFGSLLVSFLAENSLISPDVFHEMTEFFLGILSDIDV